MSRAINDDHDGDEISEEEEKQEHPTASKMVKTSQIAPEVILNKDASSGSSSEEVQKLELDSSS